MGVCDLIMTKGLTFAFPDLDKKFPWNSQNCTEMFSAEFRRFA